MGEKVTVENVNHPGHTEQVDAAKYNAMKDAILKVLPGEDAPITSAQLKQAVLPHLPDDLFPGGKAAGWWLKCVDLDLRAKGIIRSRTTKPMTFHKP